MSYENDNYCDNVVRVSSPTVCDRWRLYDFGADINFRACRGKYPREGYVPGVDSPFVCREVHKSPPLRGC